MKYNPIYIPRPFSLLSLVAIGLLTLTNALSMTAPQPTKIASNLALIVGSYYAFDVIFYQGEKTKETVGWARQKLQGSPHHNNEKNLLLAEEKIDKQAQQRKKPATLFELVGQTFMSTRPKKHANRIN